MWWRTVVSFDEAIQGSVGLQEGADRFEIDGA